ncbi:aldehyde dehydrogenase [Jeotgalibacillus sp. S-D1]|uniref:aldehyde dehydrogenase n=1 Tax=Jeotgalibacillus sp. S-D1 TaxID=2552189 RepID=UPI00105A9229|nr:aldehyde dehydrogenase [Jeotgalibacillus sp. S-D1]TDL30659.1 aldehyde dehydrogenase [Jeotgalibacillus sp. S-D1]
MSIQTEQDVLDIIKHQKEFFHSGITKNIDFRIKQLKKLQSVIKENEEDILNALKSDLGKNPFEAYVSEIGITLKSIQTMIQNVKQWAKTEKVKTPLFQMPSKSFIMKEPYGSVLIIGPFNYPFQLVIEPLIGAMAAGNCVVIKPSESTPEVTKVISKMLSANFDPAYIKVVEGEKEETSRLINAPFDYLFFTGSVPVGKIVMEAASKNLVPHTLELGGKSPTIVDETADLKKAAQRILWGKLINAGQTCIAPDYLVVHHSVKDKLIEQLKDTIRSFYGDEIQSNDQFGRIVNERHFDRLAQILEKDKEHIIVGGEHDRNEKFIPPTLLDGVTWSNEAMQDEIFGPILPILTYDNLDDAIAMINSHPKPLALYIFTENKTNEAKVLERISFGGGCVNDTLSHVANDQLPFGGVGHSGVNAYHGKHSFELFSHRKSMMKKSTRVELKLAFPPYKTSLDTIKKVLK